ncbi:MAG: hypothetical protein K5750_09430 [Eubacterium sp.]|nr:hypothetical protein [Eubacterium sp.]
MNNNRIRLCVMVALFVGAAFFMVKGKTVMAQVEDNGNYINESISMDESKNINGGMKKNVDKAKILKDSSGVTELDQAAERTNKLINWVCGWLGGIMALFGFIWAAMNQAGHNTESRNMGIVVGVIGVVIAFAPSIVKWILGK